MCAHKSSVGRLADLPCLPTGKRCRCEEPRSFQAAALARNEDEREYAATAGESTGGRACQKFTVAGIVVQSLMISEAPSPESLWSTCR